MRYNLSLYQPHPLATSSLLVCSVGTAISSSSVPIDSLPPCSVCLIVARSPAMLLNGVEQWNFALVSSIAGRAHCKQRFEKAQQDAEDASNRRESEKWKREMDEDDEEERDWRE
ncbi:hypothetical protein BLNAU_14335 [Blattamonas nauphoetae]|uniref:Uncharacterized protein n=1 Tax=Blattamonas nauphoetae TaxID=2049346 RepID=A0ABQ9XIN7_9EUKA|nr:hypothetical protein BLNAU_14335 [Blattamonas nauphoetae]